MNMRLLSHASKSNSSNSFEFPFHPPPPAPRPPHPPENITKRKDCSESKDLSPNTKKMSFCPMWKKDDFLYNFTEQKTYLSYILKILQTR